MANRNKNYLNDNERAGMHGNTFSNDPEKGINEAQSTGEYVTTVGKDGEVIVRDATLIAAAIGTGGASTAAAGAGGAAGGAVAAEGAAAGAGAAGAATAAEGAAAGGAAVEGGALGAAGESVATSAATEGAIAPGTTPDPTSIVDGSATNVEGGINQVGGEVSESGLNPDGTELSEEQKALQKSSNDAKSGNPEDSTTKKDALEDSVRDQIKTGKDAKSTLSDEKKFYESKNMLDGKKRSERMKLAQQKIDDKGKDDRGLVERAQDKQTSQTGFNQLDASGNAIDVAGRAAGSAVDASTGGKTNARETLGGMGSELTGAAGRLQNATERQLTRFAKFAFKVPLAGVGVMIAIPALIAMSFAGFGVTVASTSSVAYADVCAANNQSASAAQEVVSPGQDAPDTAGGFSWDKLTDEQKSNATQIAKAAAARNLPAQAAVIALATAMQESRIIAVNYGDEAGPDSRGIFQQRESWGDEAVRMDPFKSAGLFYDRLVAVDNWQTIPVTQAAQAVQISAYPDAYAKHESDARNVLANLVTNTNPYASELTQYPEWVTAAGGKLQDESKCDEDSGVYPTGTWLSPICDNSAMVVSNYFGPRTLRGGYSFHTGMDFYVPGQPNAPLCATAAGTVVNVAYAPRDCGNYFEVKTDDGLDYVYCHLRDAPLVTEGQHIEAGTPVGIMGTTGNSTGEHLHWEISKLGGQGTNAANPMCLFKGKPELLAKMNFDGTETDKPGYDYRCENRSDLDAWSKSVN